MPSLVLCGTKTPFSGDDLRCFCICECLFRGLQLALGLALLSFAVSQKKHVNANLQGVLLECDADGEFSPFASEGVTIMYALGSFAICLALLGISTAIPSLLVTAKGTPTDDSPRKALITLCYFNMSVMNLFRMASFTASIFAVTTLNQYCDCLQGEVVTQLPRDERLREACPDATAWLGVLIAMNTTNAIDFLVVVIEVLYFFYPCRHCPTLLPSESKWKTCFVCFIGCASTLTCCMCGGAEALRGDFGDLALVLSNYTNNNQTLDLTVSDVLAGLIMVVRRQRQKILEARIRLRQSFRSTSGRIGQDKKQGKAPFIDEGPPQKSFSDPDIRDEHRVDTQKPVLRRMASTPTLQPTVMATGGWDQDEITLSKRELLLPFHQREKMLMAEGARFMPLALGIYTWVMMLVENPILGSLRLVYLVLKRCRCFCPSPRENVYHDWPWEPHMLALEDLSGLDPKDIVFATFKQSIVAVPYMIALDHEWKSIVIAIRGTLSMEALIADLLIKPEELTAVGKKCGFDGRGRYCHRGMLASSQWIYDDIAKNGKLKELMEGEFKDYQLRVTGHSLGAGCAAILSLLLRPTYPNVRCLAFSVPGSVFCKTLAEECIPWVTSYVLDADVVPRLSIKSFEEFRNGVLKMICRIKVSKNEVFALSRSTTLDLDQLAEETDRILYDDDEIPETNFKLQIERFLEFQDELKLHDSEFYIDLYPPGEIVQLFRTHFSGSGRRILNSLPEILTEEDPTSKRGYIARWIQREDLQHLIVSSHLFLDHLPTKVLREIQNVAENKFDLKQPFYKPNDDSEA